MPTKNPRINIVLDEPMRKAVEKLARRDKVSLSLKARDLLGLALELEEDVALGLSLATGTVWSVGGDRRGRSPLSLLWLYCSWP